MKTQPILRAMTLLITALALAVGLWGVMPVARVAAEACSSAGAYRSAQSGNWNQTSTWEYCNGTDWVTATTTPTSADGTITIRNLHAVNVSESVTVDQVVVEVGGQVTINSGSTWTLANGTGTDLSINGIVLNQGTLTRNSGATWSVNADGTYIHNTTTAISAPLDGATLAPASNFFYRGQTGLIPPVSMAGRTYGNLTFESTSGSWTASPTGSNPLTVNGDFTIGSGVTYNTAQTGIMTFAGNFTNNGTLTNGAGTQVYTFSGNGKTIRGSSPIAFETWNVNVGAYITLQIDVNIASGFTGTINGTLDCGTNAVTGAGAFTLASGATLVIGSTDGINSGTIVGNIRVSGTRTFNPGANYVFSGAAAQVTGAGFPSTVNHITVANAAGVALSAATTVNGILSLTSGRFALGSNTLILGNTATVNGTPNASAMIVTDGTGALCKTYDTTGSFTFPVGETTGTAEYSPATISFNTIGDPGVACVRVIDAVHDPNPSTTNYLSRYWDVNAVDSFGAFNATLTFAYLDDDIVGSTEENMYGLRYDANAPGQKWTRFNQVNASVNTFQATVTGFSDYTAGDYNPTAVTLASFTASPQNAAIRVTWETASELDNVGFNLYRSTTADGPYTQLNDTLIPPQFPGEVMGGDYEWRDTDVQPGDVYYYKLEDIDVKGVSTFHGPVSTAVVSAPTAVTVQRVFGHGTLPALMLGLMAVPVLVIARRRSRRCVSR